MDATVKTTRTRKHILCHSARLHAARRACVDRPLPTLRGRQLMNGEKRRGWMTMYKSILGSILSLSLLPGTLSYGALKAYAPEAQPQDVSPGQVAPQIPNDQLDSLVAPIALYPDPLLSQVLVASTYPLEIIQLQQWIQRNSSLKGDDLTNAVQQQDWDPSIQAMAVFPDLVKRLADDIKWTTDLGNAFLAQQG